MDGRVDGWMCRWIDERVDRLKYEWVGRLVDRTVVGLTVSQKEANAVHLGRLSLRQRASEVVCGRPSQGT